MDRLEEKRQAVIYPLGDQAAVVRLGTDIDEEIHFKVQQLASLVEGHPFQGLTEVAITYTTLTVYYDAWTVAKNEMELEAKLGLPRLKASIIPYEVVSTYLRKLLVRLAEENKSDTNRIEPAVIRIPVCYEGEYGPDLKEVAAFHGRSAAETVKLHTNQAYKVYMLGFAPGFAYLGGLSEQLATPRRQIPRTQIPAGTVAIGGRQTGIYPLATPGGWHIIGRTPMSMFQPEKSPPTLLQAGQVVRFEAISQAQFEQWSEGGQR
jgi:inhibitor of KinA